LTTKELVQRYYASLRNKDITWQELYAENAVFSDASKTLNANGKTAVIQSFTPFLKGVKGVEVKQVITEGEDACAIINYDYVNPKGETMIQDVAEVWKIKGGQLSSLTIYFDLTVYRSFMRS
jgi:ketosteroid isomerase-like protein